MPTQDTSLKGALVNSGMAAGFADDVIARQDARYPTQAAPAVAFVDSSGTPGNVTNASPRGRAAFAAAGATVVVTSSICTANSTVLVALAGGDATATSIRVTPAAGSFTVTANAAATATTKFDFVVLN